MAFMQTYALIMIPRELKKKGYDSQQTWSFTVPLTLIVVGCLCSGLAAKSYLVKLRYEDNPIICSPCRSINFGYTLYLVLPAFYLGVTIMTVQFYVRAINRREKLIASNKKSNLERNKNVERDLAELKAL